MVARALYLQAGGSETQLSSINADSQIVRLLEFIWELLLSCYLIYKFTIPTYLYI